jgi:mRNA interferase MazF
VSRGRRVARRCRCAACAFIVVPLTSQFRGSRYEIKMPRVPWLNLQSFANVQAIGSVENHELTNRRGKFEAAVIKQIREAIGRALEL